MSNFKRYLNMYEFESVLPGSGEIVKYKPITTGQIKKLLIYENAEDSEVIERALDEIIEGCIVTDEFDINSLYLQDRFFLLLELRKVTKGNMYQFQSMCPSCNSQSLQTVDLQKLPVVVLKKSKPIVIKGPKGRTKGVVVEVKKEEPALDWDVVKINDNISVRLSPITRGMQITATDIMKENFADAPISEKAVNLSGIIFALTVQEVITPEGVEKDLSLEDRIYLVDNLTQMEMEKIPAWFDKHNFGVEFSIDIICPQCSAKSKEGCAVRRFFLLIYMLCCGTTLHTITEEQYYLASRANISIEESNLLPDFEREALLNLVVRDMKTKADNMKAAQQQKTQR